MVFTNPIYHATICLKISKTINKKPVKQKKNKVSILFFIFYKGD